MIWKKRFYVVSEYFTVVNKQRLTTEGFLE